MGSYQGKVGGSYGYTAWRYPRNEKTASLWRKEMEGIANRCRLSPEVSWLRSRSDGTKIQGRKEYPAGSPGEFLDINMRQLMESAADFLLLKDHRQEEEEDRPIAD